MQQESGGGWALLRLRVFKAIAWIWRFRTFALANTAFKNCRAPCIVTRRFFGYELYLDVSRSNAQRQLYLVGERFIHETELVNSLLKPGATVVDVGANIGYYVLLIARAVGAEGRIVAFEPEPDNLIELRMNVEGNSLSNVDVRPFAVGAETGEIAFATGLNGRVCGDLVARDTVRVPLVALDSALAEPIDVIIIDVEGYEGQVLAGARKTIEQRRPNLFVEIHPTLLYEEYTVEGVLDFLHYYYPDITLYQSIARPGLSRKIGRYLGRPNTVKLTRQAVREACREGKQPTFWAVCRARITDVASSHSP
jgi:FkbM family methyltransferase